MRIARALLTVSFVALLSAAAHAQSGAQKGEWPNFGGDLGNTKYSPLDQINARNFGQLKLAWRWLSTDGVLTIDTPQGAWSGSYKEVFAELKRTKPNRWRTGVDPVVGNLKATPLMVGGVIYLNTPLSIGVAIDAATGRTLWTYNPHSYEAGSTAMTTYWNERGVAYWTDGKEARVIWGTGDGYLVAVDAKTGKPVREFGTNGKVDLHSVLPRAGRDKRDYLNAFLFSVQSPPIVVRDVLISPMSISDRRIQKEAVPGNVIGWDVRTGKLRWTFHVVPSPGEFGADTWKNDSWSYSGNANNWSFMSGDNELGYVYVPLGTTTNDYYGGHRPGDNLFSESLVAIDVTTGKRVWHFQAVHHGLWDYDFPTAPNLIDISVGGTPIKALAQISKQGFTYVFDRVSGKPVWPIEERPVDTHGMPGDVVSPTQPFPTKPAAFEYQGVSENDLIDFTPELKEMALKAVSQYRLGPLFTPNSLHENGKLGTVFRPTGTGAGNWPGAAVDPETGMLYIPSLNEYGVIHFYTPDAKLGGTVRYTHGAPEEERLKNGDGPRPEMPEGLPLLKPPYSRITAINLNTGDHAWMVPNGNGDAIRNHPKLKPLNLPPVGGRGRGGPLLTKTLLISALVQDGPTGPRLVARDKNSGQEVGSVDLPGPALGNPVTYMLNGKQYIALTIKAGDLPELVAFALP